MSSAIAKASMARNVTFQNLTRLELGAAVFAAVLVQIGLTSCVATEPSNRAEQIATELPPLDLRQCEQSNINGRFINQGQDRISPSDPINSRLVWNLNHAFRLDARKEQAVSVVSIDHKVPNLIEMTAFDVKGNAIASAKFSAERKDFVCVNGKILILRNYTVYGEGSGINRIQIKLSKTTAGDLELFYERHFESLHYLISPYRTTINANPVFGANQGPTRSFLSVPP